MNNSYIILNRKTSFIFKVFIINVFILIGFIVWGINTFYYQSFIQLHAKFLFYNSYYFMEVLVPIKEVNQVMEQSQIVIGSKKYNYQVHKIDNNVSYIDRENYQYVYLRILDLDKSYQVNGYELDVKILKEKKKIIEYLKDEKEE